MKIIHRKIEKGGEGSVGFIAEEADDLWLIYNIIQKNDQVRTSTFRKVVTESATGASEAQKVKLTLTLAVERVQYDLDSNVVKVKGKSIEENKYVRKGQYHTFDLELNKKFYLSKPIWDSLALTQLHNAQDACRNADVAVVIMQEGLAYVCLLTTNLTIQRSKIEVNIPRKRKNFCSQHEKGMENFFEQILQAMLRHIDLVKIKCIIIASPGFTKEQFAEYMWNQAAKQEMKAILDCRSKILLAHSSTGFKHSIREILSDPEVQPKLEDTKACQEVKMWNTFQDLLSSKPERAAYGLRDVGLANHHRAIACLMISESMFRSKNLALRKRISTLMFEVGKYGAEVKIFSSMHITGQQLDQLTGIAAILKFEVPQLSELIRGEVKQKCDINGDPIDANVCDSDWSSSDSDDYSSDDEMVSNDVTREEQPNKTQVNQKLLPKRDEVKQQAPKQAHSSGSNASATTSSTNVKVPKKLATNSSNQKCQLSSHKQPAQQKPKQTVATANQNRKKDLATLNYDDPYDDYYDEYDDEYDDY